MATTLANLKKELDEEDIRYIVRDIKKEEPLFTHFIKGKYQILIDNGGIIVYLYPFDSKQTYVYIDRKAFTQNRDLVSTIEKACSK